MEGLYSRLHDGKRLAGTVKSYTQTLAAIYNTLPDPRGGLDDPYAWLTDTVAVHKHINSLQSLKSRQMYLTSIVVVLDQYQDSKLFRHYTKAFQDICDRVREFEASKPPPRVFVI